jgi:hypothetical protein
MRKALILAGALAAIATPALAVDPAKVAVMVAQMRADEQTAIEAADKAEVAAKLVLQAKGRIEAFQLSDKVIEQTDIASEADSAWFDQCLALYGPADGTFAKGFVANPAGKPKGTRHHATRLAEALIDGRAKELVDKAVDMALAGDPTAMRIVIDRLCPPRRERSVSLEMPSIKSASDLITAAAALTDATAAGDITPGEAASLSTLVGNVAKAIETVEIVVRLTKLEEHLAAKGSNP